MTLESMKSKGTPGKAMFGVCGFLVGRSWSVKGFPGIFRRPYLSLQAVCNLPLGQGTVAKISMYPDEVTCRLADFCAMGR